MADDELTTGTPAPDGSVKGTRPGGRSNRSLSADAAAAAEAAAVAEAAKLASGSTSVDASTTAGPTDPVTTGSRPGSAGPDGGRLTTSKGLVGVFPTGDGQPTETSPASDSSTASRGAAIDPEGIELLATKPFAIEPHEPVHPPTPPPTAWRATTTSSVLAAILPPMTPAETAVQSTGSEASATVATTPPQSVEAAPGPQPVAADEAGSPDVSGRLAPVEPIAPTEPTASAATIAPVEPIAPVAPAQAVTSVETAASEDVASTGLGAPVPSEAEPTESAPEAEPARDAPAAAAGLGLVAILGSTEATPSGTAPWAIATLPATAPARPPDVDPPRPTPAARSAAVPIAMAPAVAVTVGAWPKESTAPDGLIGTSLPVGRPSRVGRRALLLVLLVVVFAAGTALFFAAASGSLDRFLPDGLLSRQVVAVVEAVGRLIRPG